MNTQLWTRYWTFNRLEGKYDWLKREGVETEESSWEDQVEEKDLWV